VLNLEIVLRTHDGGNVHQFTDRYCEADKKTVVLKCVSSLANSAKLVKTTNIKFTVLDDRSSEDTLQQLDKIIKSTGHPYQIINLVNDTEMRNYNFTALKQWEACRDSDADIVYSVEDDYLHCPTALTEMIETYKMISDQLGKDICISPLDLTNDYFEEALIEPCQIGWGSHRHWKTGTHTTNTFMTTPSVFKTYWEPFYKLATEYYHEYWEVPEDEMEINEMNTINHVWKNSVKRFSPIPGLALHMQFGEQKDPFIDWKYWWDNYTEIEDVKN